MRSTATLTDTRRLLRSLNARLAAVTSVLDDDLAFAAGRISKPIVVQDADVRLSPSQVAGFRAELRELETETQRLRTLRDEEALAAESWRRRALTAAKEGRDDIAREADEQAVEHSRAANRCSGDLRLLEAELAEYDAMLRHVGVLS